MTVASDRFCEIYANLPVSTRKGIVVFIDGMPYSWNVCYTEIANMTELGKAIIQKLVEMQTI